MTGARLIIGAFAALVFVGCGDDGTATPDAFAGSDLAIEEDAGPLCRCRGDRGTLIYELFCGEGLCDGPDLLQCVSNDELIVGEGRCADDADMGSESDGGT